MRYLLACAALSAVLGVVALLVAANRPSWIDGGGFLHEPFAWMASGKIFLSFSVIFLIAASALWFVRTWRGKSGG